jgi:hypothetical protein
MYVTWCGFMMQLAWPGTSSSASESLIMMTAAVRTKHGAGLATSAWPHGMKGLNIIAWVASLGLLQVQAYVMMPCHSALLQPQAAGKVNQLLVVS